MFFVSCICYMFFFSWYWGGREETRDYIVKRIEGVSVCVCVSILVRIDKW